MLNTDFVSRVLALCGLTYEECDCKDVICKALDIRMAGTNWLWRSVNNSSKYRYLSARAWSPILQGDLKPGDVLFKMRAAIPDGYTDAPDAYHVGVYVGNGMVVHSSPNTGVRSAAYIYGAWQGWGQLKQVVYNDGHDNASHDPNNTKTEMTDHDMIKAIYNKICAERND